MYKEKKISKFALICCSFLIALSTLLAINPTWINNVYGTTLCASSTSPTITLDSFDTTVEGFIDNHDYYVSGVTFNTNENGTVAANIPYFAFTKINANAPSGKFSFVTVDVTLYSKYKNIYSGSDTLGTGTYSATWGSLSFGMYGTGLYVPVTDLASTYIIVFNLNGTYYTAISMDLYSSALVTPSGPTYEDGYNAGYTAGEGVGYNTGYIEGTNTGFTNGQNSVLNHPSDYDLYTQQQYDNNYNTGYSNGQSDVLNNPDEFDLYTQDEFDGNYTAGYNNGLDVGHQSGYSEGYGVGYAEGETEGFSDGYNAGISKEISFKNLIFAVVDVPVETMRSLFNFDLLGFNLYNFFIAILTACVLIVLIKLVIKGK